MCFRHPADLLSTKPITFYYRGSAFRSNHEEMKARAKAMGALETANFLDIVTLCGLERWIPCVIEDFSHLKVPLTKPIFLFMKIKSLNSHFPHREPQHKILRVRKSGANDFAVFWLDVLDLEC